MTPDALFLAPTVRRLAEPLMAAVLPLDAVGLPMPRQFDAFWARLPGATAPTFGPGLATAVLALTALPRFDRRYRRTFDVLAPAEQRALVAEWLRDDRFVVRQFIAIIKVVAALAVFDDPAVRAATGSPT